MFALCWIEYLDDFEILLTFNRRLIVATFVGYDSEFKNIFE